MYKQLRAVLKKRGWTGRETGIIGITDAIHGNPPPARMINALTEAEAAIYNRYVDIWDWLEKQRNEVYIEELKLKLHMKTILYNLFLRVEDAETVNEAKEAAADCWQYIEGYNCALDILSKHFEAPAIMERVRPLDEYKDLADTIRKMGGDFEPPKINEENKMDVISRLPWFTGDFIKRQLQTRQGGQKQARNEQGEK